MTSRIKLTISARARSNIEDILQYTDANWGSGQRETYDQILENAIELIQIFPDIGHPAAGQPSNIREYHLKHHIIQYRREPDRIVSPRRGHR